MRFLRNFTGTIYCVIVHRERHLKGCSKMNRKDEAFLKRQKERIQKRIHDSKEKIRTGAPHARLKAHAILPALYNALGLIRVGKYGMCIDCGTDISFERLKEVPGALRCVPCQALLERKINAEPCH
jgi:RNA polymerase-binding transcription factor DksA